MSRGVFPFKLTIRKFLNAELERVTNLNFDWLGDKSSFGGRVGRDSSCPSEATEM